MSRLFGVLMACAAMTAPFSLPASAAARANEPGQLIQAVGADVTQIVQTLSGAGREVAMRDVLHRNFDLPYVASSALGPHWNEASEVQRTRILAAFETTEAKAYADRLGTFQSVTVTGVTPKAPGVWSVDSNLNLASGKSMKVDWEVHRSGSELRISDVKVSGVSLFLTQRAAFKSYVQMHGGQVEPLVQVLEARASR